MNQTREKFLESYLVAAANHLLHSKCESKESMLTGLAILGDTSLKTTSGGVNDKDGTVSLGGTSDHVLDEVTVSRGINDSAVVLLLVSNFDKVIYTNSKQYHN